MQWDPSTLAVVDEVLGSAGSGRPTVLLVEGDPGTGKSTLLAEIVRRAPSFTALVAEAAETDTDPYHSVRGWLDVERTASGGFAGPAAAAQQVRVLLDGHAPGPVLLELDDAQWADPESMQAVTLVLRRALGDRLLVVVASRPTEVHTAWRRWLATAQNVRRLPLTGLALADAVRLARALRPGLDPAAVRALWEHTGGNPLFLRALLTEQDDVALARSRVLPAPAQFARVATLRLRRAGAPATALLRAVAVLGAGWVALPDAARVGAVDDPDAAAQALVDAGLARIRELESRTEVSAAHALVRSAVYQDIPLPERHRLHRRAAAAAPSPTAALEHRVAASGRYDDDLAEELARSGWRSYAAGSLRVAAQHLRWSSRCTADPRRREARWLDSMFASAMARDLDLVRREAADVEAAAEGLRRALVLAALDLLGGDGRRAGHLLESAVAAARPARDDGPADQEGARGVGQPEDAYLRYRVEALVAWARMGSGGSSTELLAGLESAAARGVADPQLLRVVGYAQGLARVRAGGAGAELARLAGVPADPVSVPVSLTFLLGWRGLLHLVLGLFDEAVADQQELQRRVSAGLVGDTASGGIDAYLGMSWWSLGDWDRARICFGLAAESPATHVIAPLLPLLALEPAARGDLARADELLERAERAADASSWPETPQNLLMARVVRLHADGSDAERAGLWPAMRRRWPDEMRGTGMTGVPWLMYATQAALWAADWPAAERFLARMAVATPRPTWTGGIVGWLRGLLAERRDDAVAARRRLAEAVAAEQSPDAFVRAHLLADHARLAAAEGDERGATASRQAAYELYRALSAVSYLHRVAAVAAPVTVVPGGVRGPVTNRHGLSERERDVLTLLAAGMSYQQIARELFVTRSTVKFHLGNIYAKAGVSTRHEVVAQLRTDPAAFGLSRTSVSA